MTQPVNNQAESTAKKGLKTRYIPILHNILNPKKTIQISGCSLVVGPQPARLAPCTRTGDLGRGLGPLEQAKNATQISGCSLVVGPKPSKGPFCLKAIHKKQSFLGPQKEKPSGGNVHEKPWTGSVVSLWPGFKSRRPQTAHSVYTWERHSALRASAPLSVHKEMKRVTSCSRCLHVHILG